MQVKVNAFMRCGCLCVGSRLRYERPLFYSPDIQFYSTRCSPNEHRRYFFYISYDLSSLPVYILAHLWYEHPLFYSPDVLFCSLRCSPNEHCKYSFSFSYDLSCSPSSMLVKPGIYDSTFDIELLSLSARAVDYALFSTTNKKP